MSDICYHISFRFVSLDFSIAAQISRITLSCLQEWPQQKWSIRMPIYVVSAESPRRSYSRKPQIVFGAGWRVGGSTLQWRRKCRPKRDAETWIKANQLANQRYSLIILTSDSSDRCWAWKVNQLGSLRLWQSRGKEGRVEARKEANSHIVMWEITIITRQKQKLYQSQLHKLPVTCYLQLQWSTALQSDRSTPIDPAQLRLSCSSRSHWITNCSFTHTVTLTITVNAIMNKYDMLLDLTNR